MADNVSVTAGSGTTIAADDVGGVLYQRVKVVAGADGAATDVSAAAPLPVTDASGATAANQTTGNASLATLAGAVAGTEVQVDVLTVGIPSSLYHGQTTVTTAGTEVALGASQALLSGVTVKALHGNTGMIFVGANPVTSSTGFALAAGEQIFLEISNVATVYVDSSVNGEKVSWIGS